MYRIIRFTALCTGLSLWFSGTGLFGQGLPGLTFDRPDLAPGAGVTFHVLAALTDDPPDNHPLRKASTDDHAYELLLDLRATRWSENCDCFVYLFYARVSGSVQSGSTTKYKVSATPAGQFEDRYRNIRFTLTASGQEHSGTISMPLGSTFPAPPPLLRKGGIEPVGLYGDTEVDVRVQNTLSDMTLEVVLPTTITLANSRLWQSATVPTGAATVVALQPKAEHRIRVVLHPWPMKASEASFPPTDPDVSHTAFDFDLHYRNPYLEGRVGFVPINVPVRFTPNIVTLMICLVFGVIIGSLATALTPGATGNIRAWPRAAACALLVAIIFYFVASLLVHFKSKLVLFGLELNPSEGITTLLLGAFMGLLGFKATALLNDFLAKSGKKV